MTDYRSVEKPKQTLKRHIQKFGFELVPNLRMKYVKILFTAAQYVQNVCCAVAVGIFESPKMTDADDKSIQKGR